jgi:O-antigen/teichoic acid export membrane protein
MALLNVVLSFILIPKYGVLGTAIALGFSLFIGNGIIMNIYYYYKVGINIPLFWMRILSITPSFVIPITIGYLIKRFITISNFASLGITVIIFLLVYIISVWLIGLDDFERNYFSNAISKFRKK